MGLSPRPYPSLDEVPGVPGRGGGCAGSSEEHGRTALMLALPGLPRWASGNFSLSFLFCKVEQGIYFPDFTAPRAMTAQLTAAVTHNDSGTMTAGQAHLTLWRFTETVFFTN